MYSASITVGTPPQMIRVNFDTSSADSWIPSSFINLSGFSNNIGPLPNSFNSSTSSTYRDRSNRFAANLTYPFAKLGSLTATYGDVSVSGYLSSDSFTVAGLQVANQAFTLVTDETLSAFAFGRISEANGVIGLAYPSASVYSGVNRSFFQNLINNQRIPQAVFAFSFNNKYAFIPVLIKF